MINSHLEAKAILHSALIEHCVIATCINCEYWKNDICTKYNAVPPPRIIVYGCETWNENLPF